MQKKGILQRSTGATKRRPSKMKQKKRANVPMSLHLHGVFMSEKGSSAISRLVALAPTMPVHVLEREA